MSKKLVLSIAGLVVLLAVTIHSDPQRKLLLYNPSESLPPGFYRLTNAAPAKGTIINFPLPERIRGYVGQRLGKPVSDDWTLIKHVVAVEGDHVCVDDDGFSVNGKRLAGVPLADSLGKPVPVWRECRPLNAGEFFVFSGRIERSLDSRYLGPIQARDICGVYVPLWTWGEVIGVNKDRSNRPTWRVQQ